MFDFRHQVVRDLAWCCTSAPLLAQLPNSDAQLWPSIFTQYDAQWLAGLDLNPEPLLAELVQLKSTRLGIYFEALWRFYWQQHADWNLLAHNLQVSDNGITLGAFDFLLQHQEKFWHVETAVKFYLGYPDAASSANWHQWIGPNCSDRLDIKLERLVQHQLPLSQQAHGKNDLIALINQDVYWNRALCLQGYFFYPSQYELPAPDYAHPNHCRGRWWHLQDFHNDLRASNIHQEYWMILPRERWLSPAQTTELSELIRGETLLSLLTHWVGENQRPQLLAALAKIDGVWKEVERGFVVPDHWPNTDLPSRNK